MSTLAPRIRHFFREYLKIAPTPLALLRAEEAALFAQEALAEPILDIGSGDGLFASVTMEKPIDVGLDMSRREIDLALPRKAYKAYVQARADVIPLSDDTFASVMSNCVFEHIPEYPGAFREIFRVLRPGGRFVFTAHSHHYDGNLLYPRLFRSVGLGFLARWYLKAINALFKHYNCLSPEEWTRHLEAAGFQVEVCRYYFPKASMRRFDLLLPLGLPAYFNKKYLGRWVLFGKPFLADIFGAWAQPGYAEAPDQGGALFFVAVKPQKGD